MTEQTIDLHEAVEIEAEHGERPARSLVRFDLMIKLVLKLLRFDKPVMCPESECTLRPSFRHGGREPQSPYVGHAVMSTAIKCRTDDRNDQLL